MSQQRLRPAQYAIGLAGLAGIAAVAAFYWVFSGAKLEYVELDRPPGFRAVHFGGSSSNTGAFGNALVGISVPGAQQELDKTPLNLCQALLADPRSPAAGPTDAAVTIVEFTDYRCPYCRTLTRILAEVRREADIRIVYKEWPILSEASHLAARAALAAAGQGQYAQLHERLMGSSFALTKAYIRELAEGLGVDADRLEADMSSDRVAEALNDNNRLAEQLGLLGTPALIVGRTIVQGAVTKAQLLQVIDNEAAEPQACPSPATPSNATGHAARRLTLAPVTVALATAAV